MYSSVSPSPPAPSPWPLLEHPTTCRISKAMRVLRVENASQSTSKSDAQYLLGEMVVTACSMVVILEGPARRGGLGRRPPGGDPRLSVLQRQKLKAEPHEKVVVVEWVIQYFPVVVGSAPIVIVRNKQVQRLHLYK